MYNSLDAHVQPHHDMCHSYCVNNKHSKLYFYILISFSSNITSKCENF